MLLSRAAQLLPAGVARRAVQNAGWLLGERLLNMSVRFAVTVWLVRYLGPEDFGIFSFAISLSILVEVAVSLGIAQIVVRELVRAPEEEPTILGSATALQFTTGATVASLMILGVWLSGADARLLAVAALLVGAMPLHAFANLDLAFQARMQSRYSVIARMTGFLIATTVKVALLWGHAPLVAIAGAYAVEPVLTLTTYAVIYIRTGHRLTALRVRTRQITALVREGWPLLIGGVGSVLYLRVDQVLLQGLASSAELGVYAAAARLSEIWYFVPQTIATAVFPVLVSSRDDPEQQRRYAQRVFDIVGLAAIALAVFVTLFAGVIVNVLYGPEFRETASILRVHVWTAPFMFLGTLGGRLLIANGLQRYEAARHLVGAPINIALNLFLIPQYGAMGAAVATLVAYVTVSYVILLVLPPTRSVALMMTRTWLFPVRALRSLS